MSNAGDVIRSKYRIDRVIGRGGMGEVVEAHHLGLDRKVAIKFLHPSVLSNPDLVERFAREAKAATRIESDHVARVLDVDALEDGTPFMVMEYLEGNDLAVVRRSKNPLPIPLAIDYLVQACDAIHEAHRLGIVHRDIKPSNLFVARRSDGKTRLKVLDFGISKVSSADNNDGMTKTTAVMGSVEYMSPEQMLASREVDARSDIWALGVTLYELLTAKVPFPGQVMTQVCAMVMSEPATPPSAYRPEIPPALDAIILKCLEKSRDHRFASVPELVEALTLYGGSSGVSLVPGDPSSSPVRSTLRLEPEARAQIVSSLGFDSRPRFDARPPHPSVSSFPATPISQPYEAMRPPSSGAIAPSNAVVSAETGHGLVQTGSAIRPASSRAPLAIVVGLFTTMMIGATAWIAVGAISRSSAATSASATASDVSASAMPTIATANDVTPPSPSPSNTTPPSTVTPSPSEVETSVASAAPSAVAPKPASTVAAVSPAPLAEKKPAATGKANGSAKKCDPPFTLDANGIKHAKPECL